jgi:methanogenic corrinoid protein MtbC1
MASSVGTTRSRVTAPDVISGTHLTDVERVQRPSHRALASLVEEEVIPRLMLAHAVDSYHGSIEGIEAVGNIDLEAFVPLALECDARSLLIKLDDLIAQGVSVEAIMVEVLAPAARRLGEWWSQDRCDFVEVTMGLWRLQEVVRELSTRIPPSLSVPDRGRLRRALFAAFPGEQHNFGAIMVGEMFHRNGWDVETLLAAEMPDLLVEIGRHHYDIIGLTVSCDCHRTRIPSAILAVRSVSRNPRVRVMIGGPIFVEDPALAAQFGADATAPDARQALVVAEALVDAIERDLITCS